MHPTFDPSYVPVCAVYGLGTSGFAAMQLFKERGIAACCWDDDPEMRYRAVGQGFMIQDFSRLGLPQHIQTLLISPGVPWNGSDQSHPAAKLAALAQKHHVRVCCDIDWLLRNAVNPANPMQKDLIFADANLGAVTGTNGKTSVVNWIEGIVQAQGFHARALGNNGVAVMDDHEDVDFLIFELSSYQLDLMEVNAFERVMLLNISPDHLERYGSIEAYCQSKAQILQMLKAQNSGAVIGVDDPYALAIAEAAEAEGITVLRFSTEQHLEGHIYLDQGQLIDHRDEVPQVVLDVTQDPLLDNLQHMRNLTAVYAFLCVYFDQAKSEDWYAQQSFSHFAQTAARKLRFDHRQNPIAYRDQTLFVDDSKATNPIAAADALRQFRHIHWVAGGQAKLGGFSDLQDCFADVQAVYLFGASRQALADYLVTQNLPKDVTIHLHPELHSVMTAIGEVLTAAPDQLRTVLFSPACASFDQFANYVERGRTFIRFATELGAKPIIDLDDTAVSSLNSRLRRGLIAMQESRAAKTDADHEDRDASAPDMPVAEPELVARPTITPDAPRVLRDNQPEQIPSVRQRNWNPTVFLGNWLSEVDMVSIFAIMIVYGFSLTIQSILSVHVSNISFAKQMVIGLSGFAGMIVMSMLSRRAMMQLLMVAMVLTTLAMVWSLTNGITIKGSSRWINIPGVNFSLQPIELFKASCIAILGLILGHACFMGYRRRVRVLIGGICIGLMIMLPLLQPDAGQSILMFVALGTIVVLACDRYALSVGGLFGVFFGALVGLLYWTYPHFTDRLNDFLQSNYDSTDQAAVAAYTVEHARLFLGGADLFSSPWYRLSDIESDFVFTMMLQEFGIILSLFPVLLMLFVLLRSVRLLWKNQDITWRLWNWGLVVMLSGQIFVNIGSATNMLPPKGITLPLLSYGGSSVLGVFFALGMILFMTRQGSAEGEIEFPADEGKAAEADMEVEKT